MSVDDPAGERRQHFADDTVICDDGSDIEAVIPGVGLDARDFRVEHFAEATLDFLFYGHVYTPYCPSPHHSALFQMKSQ